MKKASQLKLIIICTSFIVLLMIVMLVWFGQKPSFFYRKPQILRVVHKSLTSLPCQFWRIKIRKDTASSVYLSCQKDDDCVWYPSCEFGCQSAYNIQSSKQLQRQMDKWGRFCWQNNPCAAFGYFCEPPKKVRCKDSQCQASY